MLRSLHELKSHPVAARDGRIGEVSEFLFDDRMWAIRYLTVQTGSWLQSRKVLITPEAVHQPGPQFLPVELTREQIEQSPPIEQNKPVSLYYQDRLHRYYGWSMYWHTPDFPGSPGIAYPPPEAAIQAAQEKEREEEKAHDPHLRSTESVRGYAIHATNGDIGHASDFIADTESWVIRYLIVDTGGFFSGKKVIVSPGWTEKIDWHENSIHLTMTREAVKMCPPYDPERPVNREYEEVLYDYYGRPKYWSLTGGDHE